MHSLILECPAAGKDRLIAELWEQGTTGVIERELASDRVVLQAFFNQVFPADAPTRTPAPPEQSPPLPA